MTQKNTPRGVPAGLDAALSPAMRSLLVKIAINRLALKDARGNLDQAAEALAGLAQRLRQVDETALGRRAEALATADSDKRHGPYLELTEAMIQLAQQHPPGAIERAAMMGLVDQVNQIMANAQEARRQELGALLRLDALLQDAEAQQALERKQGGGVH